jgi:hypothetical protein
MITFTSRGLTNASQLETGAIVAAAGPPVAAAINAVIVGAAVIGIALRSPRLRGFTSRSHVGLAEASVP